MKLFIYICLCLCLSACLRVSFFSPTSLSVYLVRSTALFAIFGSTKHRRIIELIKAIALSIAFILRTSDHRYIPPSTQPNIPPSFPTALAIHPPRHPSRHPSLHSINSIERANFARCENSADSQAIDRPHLCQPTPIMAAFIEIPSLLLLQRYFNFLFQIYFDVFLDLFSKQCFIPCPISSGLSLAQFLHQRVFNLLISFFNKYGLISCPICSPRIHQNLAQSLLRILVSWSITQFLLQRWFHPLLNF